MSPFALQIRKIRTARKLQQKTMAEIIGCEPSYISALERDAKVPPQRENLLQLLKKLNLSIEEETDLLVAAEKSKRSIRLPLKASKLFFEIFHELEKQMTSIDDDQLLIIGLGLKLSSNEIKEMGGPKM
ncbi:MAG: helix-turn-helix domain-containing protein [Methylophilus sp.]